ncbi:biotin synthase BioB [Sporolactobacillus shoreicorticis]|uniref:Biotin synthase n=1 Tax=Sporolactobacillus shoreicorticis TaxID=1923877 RepID=A0ABW5SA58_9BACL|nr:biotin synthase BioB [Sporolactobacillus shoreicorticis]MCO7127414.1 biotin synthase BioB [Sporolactobacillus shoreicorticis]
MKWYDLAQNIIAGDSCTVEDARQILSVPDDETIDLVCGAYQLRKQYFGTSMKLNLIINAKSGRCAEDCGYCSQSIYADTSIEEYPLVHEEIIVNGAKQAYENQISTYCIVMSGRRAAPREIRAVCSAVEKIKETMPTMKICACLGLINEEQAKALKNAGVDRFNHNLNTSAAHYDQIATTHRYQDRVGTIEAVKKANISPCSGVICGMGETDHDIIDMAFALKELDADSIPVNFLNPIPGTKLENRHELTPNRCLKILALFRFINPTKEIRIAGGREVNLRSSQNLGLYIANLIFIGDYLTTEGQNKSEDYQMIADLGFEIEAKTVETKI